MTTLMTWAGVETDSPAGLESATIGVRQIWRAVLNSCRPHTSTIVGRSKTYANGRLSQDARARLGPAPSTGRFAGQGRHPPVFAAAETPRPQSTYPSAADAAGSSQQPWTGGTSPDVATEQPRRRRTVVCYSCGHPGHISRECPSSRRGSKGVRRRVEASESYVDAVICGTHYPLRLDSGCDRSIIPRKLVPSAVLDPWRIRYTQPTVRKLIFQEK